MARLKREMVDIDPETGMPVFHDDIPQSNGPDTAATRKTAEMNDALSGEDKKGTGYITVHFLGNGKGGREILVLKEDADIYQRHEIETMVKDEFAPLLHENQAGTYRFRMYVHNGKQHTKTSEDTFTVLAGTRKAGHVPSMALATQPVTSPTSDPALVALLSQNALLLQRLAEPKASPVFDMMKDTAPLWLPILGTAVTTWLSRKPDNGLEVLERALAMTGTIKDLRGDDGGNAQESGSPWVPIIGKALDGIGMMMSQKALMVSPAAPAPIAQGGVPATSTGMPGHPLYPQLVNLLPIADADADPEETAAALWEKLPADVKPAFMQFLDRREAIRDMIAVHPDVALYADWFGDLKRALMDLGRASVQDTGQQEQSGQVYDNGSGSDHVAGNTGGG